MMTFRQLLAFAMYATALWLAWVLSVQTDPGHLVALLLAGLALAFGLWALGASQGAGGWKRAVGFVPLLLASVVVAWLLPRSAASTSTQTSLAFSNIAAEPYSRARLDSLRAQGRAVFVNATAAWCVTCLVNEKVALDDSRVRAAFAEHNVAYLVADWTRRNAEVTALLSSQGRDGVPLYIYYPPGSAHGRILPQILTADAILSALSGT
jgi:thiol:disulfide interchange protein DsbD